MSLETTPATAPPTTIGLIGAGYFSQFHVDGWARLDGASLVAVADQSLEAAQRRIAEHARGEPTRAYDDVQKMLDTERPEIVDIATPPGTHAEMIDRAIASGAKLIICQKPFCGDLAGATAATRKAEAAGVPLIVHENFRFQPWYREIKRLLDGGAVGPVHQISFRLRPGDGKGPRAYLERQPYFQKMPRFLIHETGVHWIDTFRFLMGEPEAVYADLRKMNPVIAGEDAGMFVLHFAEGRRAVFDGDRLVDHGARNCRRTMGEAWIDGQDAVITLDGDGRIFLRRAGALEATDTGFEAPPDGVGFGGDCVAALQGHVLHGHRGGGAIENTGRDYLRVMAIEEAIYRSAETGAKVGV